MTLTLCAVLWLAAPAPAPAPASAPSAAPASRPVNEQTRPELFRDTPPGRPELDAVPGDGAPESRTSFWASFLLRTVLGLGIIVMLAYLILNKGLGRLMKAQGLGSASRMVKLVERLPLGAKNSVYLVEVEGRRLLIGTAENTTTLIADVSSPRHASVADVLAKESE